MSDRLQPQHADADRASPPALGGAGLTAADLALLWRLARALHACDTPAEAEALAAQAVAAASGCPPTLAAAIADTVTPALEGLRQREQLRSLAIRDPLTGLYNRRFLEDELARQIARVQDEGGPLAVALLDLDQFRDYNARHGHLAGDLVLRSLAVLLEGFCQGSDVPCRYGGEEFVCIMPAATAAQAAARLEPLRRRLAETGIHHEGRLLQPVTASIGVAECRDAGTAAVALVDRADRAMYRAKRSGGNRICSAGTSAE